MGRSLCNSCSDKPCGTGWTTGNALSVLSFQEGLYPVTTLSLFMPSPNPYEQFYVRLRFEREGLFRLLARLYKIRSVYYPCCSFHITPSFFFDRVYYLDKSDGVARFFADRALIDGIIRRRGENSRASWEFVHADVYNTGSSIPPVDMLLSLFGGDHLEHSQRYLRKGGYVVTSSEFSGRDFLEGNPSYRKLTELALRSGEYRVLAGEDMLRRNRKNFTKDLVFRDTAIYSVYVRERY